MPRGRPKNASYEEPEAPTTVTERNVEDFVGQFGGEDYKIKVFRFDEQGTRKWKATLPMIALNEEIIYRKFGPGKYYMVMVDAGGKYLKKEHAGQMIALTVDIEGPDGEGEYQPQQQVIQSGNDPMMTLLMQQMSDARQEAARAREQAEASQQRLHEMMIAVISRPAAVSGSDPALMIGALTGAMASMKQLTGGDGSGSDISKLKELVGLANELKSSGGEEDASPASLLLTGLKSLPALIGAGQRPEVQAQPVRAVIPADNPPGPGPELDVSPYENLVDRLIQKAEHGRDAGLQADAVIDDGDEGRPEAIAFVQTLLQCESFEAWRVGPMKARILDPHVKWFEEFYKAVVETFDLQEPEAEKPIDAKKVESVEVKK